MPAAFAQCATLSVPEDYADPDGRRLDLCELLTQLKDILGHDFEVYPAITRQGSFLKKTAGVRLHSEC